MTDQELAARARDGDQDAFEQLVRDNEKRIYTLALRMTGSREDALDLAQEIAQVLDLDLGTVKSRIARARLSLRKILLEDGNFFDSPASMEIERHRKE